MLICEGKRFWQRRHNHRWSDALTALPAKPDNAEFHGVDEGLGILCNVSAMQQVLHICISAAWFATMLLSERNRAGELNTDVHTG